MNGLVVSARRYKRNGGNCNIIQQTDREGVCDECVYFWVIFQSNILE
jgi:hypothetical protein